MPATPTGDRRDGTAARALLCAALALALAAAPAAAAPEAADIWTDLRAALAAGGYELAIAEEEIGDDAVRLAGVTLTSLTEGRAMDEVGAMVPSTTRATVEIAEMTLTEAGERVEIALSETLPVRVETRTGGEDPVTISARILLDGFEAAVEEDGPGLLYTYGGASQRVVLDEVTGGDGALAGDLRVEGLTGTAATRPAADGAPRRTEQSQEAGALTVEMSFEDPDPAGGGSLALALAVSDLSGTSRTLSPEEAEMADLAAFARAGGELAGTFAYGPARIEVAVTGASGDFDLSTASSGGAIEVSIDEGGLAYALSATGSRASVRGGGLPVPELSYALESSAIDILVPILAGAGAQPFALSVALQGLVLDDAVWALFDPGTILPRDPASVTLDLAGTATLPQDLLPAPDGDGDDTDTGAGVPEPEAEAPTLRTLTVEALSLSAAGARLDASGAFDAPEDGTPALPGLPALAGTLSIDLAGAEGLLDALVTMGVLPQEQAAFARGMLGFVARPTGADSYATELDLGADGSVTANGMALR